MKQTTLRLVVGMQPIRLAPLGLNPSRLEYSSSISLAFQET